MRVGDAYRGTAKQHPWRVRVLAVTGRGVTFTVVHGPGKSKGRRFSMEQRAFANTFVRE